MGQERIDGLVSSLYSIRQNWLGAFDYDFLRSLASGEPSRQLFAKDL